MIAADKRKAVFLLHQEGMEVREIARRLAVSRNAVRTIIRQQGATTPRVRADKQRLDEELLRRLYQECQGRMVRVHEKLVEEEGLAVSYPTLTRMLRMFGGFGGGGFPRRPGEPAPASRDGFGGGNFADPPS